MASKNLSFLPDDYLEKRVARRTNIICVTLFAIVMVGVVAAYLATDRKRAEVQELQQRVNTQFEDAARRLEQLEQLQQRKKQMIHKARITSVLVERVPRTLMLSELINHMPPTLSLLQFDLGTKTIRTAPQPRTSLERAKQRVSKRLKQEQEEPEIAVPATEVSIDIVGLAPTDLEVSQFIGSLNGHEMFNDVTLLFSEQVKVEDQEMRKFRMTMTLNQAIDVHEIEPTKVRRELAQNPMSRTIRIDQQGRLVQPQ